MALNDADLGFSYALPEAPPWSLPRWKVASPGPRGSTSALPVPRASPTCRPSTRQHTPHRAFSDQLLTAPYRAGRQSQRDKNSRAQGVTGHTSPARGGQLTREPSQEDGPRTIPWGPQHFTPPLESQNHRHTPTPEPPGDDSLSSPRAQRWPATEDTVLPPLKTQRGCSRPADGTSLSSQAPGQHECQSKGNSRHG